ESSEHRPGAVWRQSLPARKPSSASRSSSILVTRMTENGATSPSVRVAANDRPLPAKIPWASGWRSSLFEGEVAAPPTLEATMSEEEPRPAQAAIRTDL